MPSPVSGTALGECNAIRSHGCGLGELTFVSALELRSALPISPFRASEDTCLAAYLPIHCVSVAS